jgi:capsular polysaccharide biosynthesis protein
MQFDPRIRSLGGNVQPSYKAYPLLATSDEIVSALIVDLEDKLVAGEWTVQQLRKMLEAKSNGDPSLIRLSVRNDDPERAAAIANQWAERFVLSANELYAQSSDDLTFFDAQQTEAEEELAQAEQDLVDFQALNRAAILDTQLISAREALTTTLKAAHSLEMTLEDARALQKHLRTRESTAAASPSDELAALLIEITALNQGSSKIQLQLSTEQNLGDKTVGDQITFLDSLIPVLEERLVLLQEQAQALEPEILDLQKAFQEVQAEESRLQIAQKLANDTFVSLSRKATEAGIAAQDTTGDVRLASRATPSRDPVSPRKTLNTLIAGALGLVVGIVVVLAIEYWRKGQQEAEAS